MTIDGLSLPDYYRAIGQNPFECSMYGCDNSAVFFVAAEPCGADCDHMHGLPSPMCEAHSQGVEIVGTTGD